MTATTETYVLAVKDAPPLTRATAEPWLQIGPAFLLAPNTTDLWVAKLLAAFPTHGRPDDDRLKPQRFLRTVASFFAVSFTAILPRPDRLKGFAALPVLADEAFE